MVNYTKGKVYTLRTTNNPDLLYVGSTCQTLCQRFQDHKAATKSGGPKCLHLPAQIINCGGAYIELHEEYPCDSLEQLRRREGEVMRELASSNTRIAGRTYKEWREDNKEHICQQKKEYREHNKETIRVAKHQYREANKEVIRNSKRAYYQANKEHTKAKTKQWYEDNKQKVLACQNARVVCPLCQKEMSRCSLWKHKKVCPQNAEPP